MAERTGRAYLELALMATGILGVPAAVTDFVLTEINTNQVASASQAPLDEAEGKIRAIDTQLGIPLTTLEEQKLLQDKIDLLIQKRKIYTELTNAYRNVVKHGLVDTGIIAVTGAAGVLGFDLRTRRYSQPPRTSRSKTSTK